MTKQELANYNDELKSFFTSFPYEAQVEAIMDWIGNSTNPDVSHQLTILLLIWEHHAPQMGPDSTAILSKTIHSFMHSIDSYPQGHSSIKCMDHGRQEVTLSVSLSHGAIDLDDPNPAPVFNLRIMYASETGLGSIDVFSITPRGVMKMSSSGANGKTI